MIEPKDAAEYLKAYIRQYREAYALLTKPAPEGGGFPPLLISPYLNAKRISCHLMASGVKGAIVVVVGDWQTKGRTTFYQAGSFPEEITSGVLPPAIDGTKAGAVFDDVEITVTTHTCDPVEFVSRLTLGTLPRAATPGSHFWLPLIIRSIQFTAIGQQSTQHQRAYEYIECLADVESCAWDTRTIWARVQADIRRDFASAFYTAGRDGGGMLEIPGPHPRFHLQDRLTALQLVIVRFEELLEDHGEEDERVFHDFIRSNPVLLDVYGIPTSKPRLMYPEGESPLGKRYYLGK